MSRRKINWLKHIVQSGGNIDKLFPSDVKGKGKWLVDVDIPNKSFEVSSGAGEGHQVSLPMSQRKEELVRKWTSAFLR